MLISPWLMRHARQVKATGNSLTSRKESTAQCAYFTSTSHQHLTCQLPVRHGMPNSWRLDCSMRRFASDMLVPKGQHLGLTDTAETGMACTMQLQEPACIDKADHSVLRQLFASSPASPAKGIHFMPHGTCFLSYGRSCGPQFWGPNPRYWPAPCYNCTSGFYGKYCRQTHPIARGRC